MHNFVNTSFDNVWRYILAHFVHVCAPMLHPTLAEIYAFYRSR